MTVERMVLPEFLRISVKKQPGVLFLGEVGFDSEFFNELAWKNLLKMLQNRPDINAVIIDGALSRLHRPEFLTDQGLFTYWNNTTAEAEKISYEIPNYEQFDFMAKIQESILKLRLQELRETCPKLKIILSMHSDAMQHNFTYRLNEILVSKHKTLSESIDIATADINNKKNKCRKFKSAIETAKRRQKTTKNTDAKTIARLAASLTKAYDGLQATEKEIKAQRKIIEEHQAQQKLFRDKKIRPTHQVWARKLTENIFAGFKTLCKETKTYLIFCPTILMFQGQETLVIDYSHSRHYTWGTIKANDQTLIHGFHGKISKYQEQIKKITGGYITDIVLQGHHGTGWKQTQRTHYQTASLNFNDIGCYDSQVEEQYIHFIVAPTFEDQIKISQFSSEHRPDRMGPSGKATGSRNNPAIDRLRNGGVSGTLVMTKNNLGIGTQVTAYKKYLDGSVLITLDLYHAVIVSSDEHISHPASDPGARFGLLMLCKQLSKKAFRFRGQKAIVCGYINAGDPGEANTSKWPFRPDHKPSAEEIKNKIIELETTDNPDKYSLIMELIRVGMSGSVENMDDTLSAIADYFMGFFLTLLKTSKLKYIIALVPGNHISGAFAKVGMTELAYFKERLKNPFAPQIKIFQVGISGDDVNNTDPEVRIALGGYETALALFIEKYGLNKNNEPLFGPIRLQIIHDPKGSGKTGLVGATKSAEADLGIAGHTHETWYQLVNTGPNEFSVALRIATMQKITATEIKYAGSLPRTSGAHMFLMPTTGDFAEQFLSMNILRSLGREEVLKQIEEKSKK